MPIITLQTVILICQTSNIIDSLFVPHATTAKYIIYRTKVFRFQKLQIKINLIIHILYAPAMILGVRNRYIILCFDLKNHKKNVSSRY